MAYIVKGRTFSSYYSVKWNKSKPIHFQHIFLEAETEDDAIESARSIYQNRFRQTPMIDSVSSINTSAAAIETQIDWDKPWYQQRLVSFDVETTGVDPVEGKIVEIGFSEFDISKKKFMRAESFFLNEGVPIPDEASAIHGISNEMIEDAPTLSDMMDYFSEKFFTPETILISHNRGFDMGFLLHGCFDIGSYITNPCWCSMELAIRNPCGQEKNTLEVVADHFGVEGSNSHRAGDDAELAGNVFLKIARQSKFFHNASTREVMDYFDKNPTIEPNAYFSV